MRGANTLFAFRFKVKHQSYLTPIFSIVVVFWADLAYKTTIVL